MSTPAEQSGHAAHDGHEPGQDGQPDADEDHCPCFCDIVGHCAGGAPGTVAGLAPAIDSFPRGVTAPPMESAALTPPHRNRLYRPPSSR